MKVFLLPFLQCSNAGTNGIFLGAKKAAPAATAESAAQSIASSAAAAGLSSMSSMSGMSLSSMTTAVSPPAYSFPTYPAVNDFSSGTCAGEDCKLMLPSAALLANLTA
jgi:hypothetical protein